MRNVRIHGTETNITSPALLKTTDGNHKHKAQQNCTDYKHSCLEVIPLK